MFKFYNPKQANQMVLSLVMCMSFHKPRNRSLLRIMRDDRAFSLISRSQRGIWFFHLVTVLDLTLITASLPILIAE